MIFLRSAAVGLAALLLAAGCSKQLDDVKPNVDPKYKDADDQTTAVSQTLAQLTAAAGNPTDFAPLFADAAAVPKDRAAFGKREFKPDSIPKVSGDNMEMTVEVAHLDNMKPPQSIPWKFRKVGDAWKIVDAPLAGKAIAAAKYQGGND